MANKLIYTYIHGTDGDANNSFIPETYVSAYWNSLIFDVNHRTIWHQGMPFGNAYPGTLSYGEIFNDFDNNIGKGAYSHAEGKGTTAMGDSSHAEGKGTTTNGMYSHAEGNNSYAYSTGSHAEGNNSYAKGDYSHAEGIHTYTYSTGSHAEGNNTQAGNEHDLENGKFAHAEGDQTIAAKEGSHAEGYKTQAGANYAHAEGDQTNASNQSAHAEGEHSTASGRSSHAEGNSSIAKGDYSHAEGDQTNAGNQSSHAEGEHSRASGRSSHAEGNSSNAEGDYSHAEGTSTISSGSNSHAEGYESKASGFRTHAEGNKTIASGSNSHAEGNATQTTGQNSHAEGYESFTFGDGSHAEGMQTKSAGNYSHTEGDNTYSGISAFAAHAEGKLTYALGTYAHAEGLSTYSNGIASHAEGFGSAAYANYSHAGGSQSIADNVSSIVFGVDAYAYPNQTQYTYGTYSETKLGGAAVFGLGTHTKNNVEAAFGRYNQSYVVRSMSMDKTDCENNPTLFSVGIGISDINRKNAFDIRKDGTTYLYNTTYSWGGNNDTAYPEGLYQIATYADVMINGVGKRNFAHRLDDTIPAYAEYFNKYVTDSDGKQNNAYGDYSHAEGIGTYTFDNARGAHVEGIGTFAYNEGEHASGLYNKSIYGETLFSVGDGNNYQTPHNVFEIKNNTTRSKGTAFIDDKPIVTSLQYTGIDGSVNGATYIWRGTYANYEQVVNDNKLSEDTIYFVNNGDGSSRNDFITEDKLKEISNYILQQVDEKLKGVIKNAKYRDIGTDNPTLDQSIANYCGDISYLWVGTLTEFEKFQSSITDEAASDVAFLIRNK